jgi:hypothetical protein
MYTQVMKWVSIASLLPFVYGVISAAAVAADLSQYRNIQFGTDLSAVAKQVGVSPSEAKVIHSRPALIQELAWSPRALGSSPQTESVDKVIFSFYNSELYRIVINYNRYEIEGLTAEDMVDAISVTYGAAAKPAAPVKAAQDRYGDQEDVIARWQDPQYDALATLVVNKLRGTLAVCGRNRGLFTSLAFSSLSLAASCSLARRAASLCGAS